MNSATLANPSVGDLDLDDLRELMLRVNSTTEALHSTHAALHQEVARLQAELREANAQLKRSKALAALGEMAAGIAHEIRNPLGSIGLYAQALEEEVCGQGEAAALCSKISRSVTMVDAIVRDVLLFAKNLHIAPSPMPVGALLEGALAGCESQILGANIAVERTGHESLVVSADCVLITQALSNLVRNAIDAMREREAPRTLTTRCSRESIRVAGGDMMDHIVVAVEDTGPGIPEDVIERIFNPFFTTRATGTGLGLAIVNRITEAHGGHVAVCNTGMGARVSLCLPCMDANVNGDEESGTKEG